MLSSVSQEETLIEVTRSFPNYVMVVMRVIAVSTNQRKSS